MVVGVYLGTVGMLAPTGVGIVDFWGLANPIGARFDFPTVKPGHSKPLGNAWLLADYAAPEAPAHPSGDFAVSGTVTPEQVSAAERTQLRRPRGNPTINPGTADIEALLGQPDRRLAPDPSHHSPDPFEAEQEFCGRP